MNSLNVSHHPTWAAEVCNLHRYIIHVSRFSSCSYMKEEEDVSLLTKSMWPNHTLHSLQWWIYFTFMFNDSLPGSWSIVVLIAEVCICSAPPGGWGGDCGVRHSSMFSGLMSVWMILQWWWRYSRPSSTCDRYSFQVSCWFIYGLYIELNSTHKCLTWVMTCLTQVRERPGLPKHTCQQRKSGPSSSNTKQIST